jgi:hypothetical protein
MKKRKYIAETKEIYIPLARKHLPEAATEMEKLLVTLQKEL